MALTQSQYGGDRAPAVAPANGGASVLSGLASAAFGMFTGGLGPAATSALGAATGDTSTLTIQPKNDTNQSTGSKVFNLPGTQDAFSNNNYWKAATGGNGLIAAVLVVAVVVLAIFLIRRK